MKLNNLTSLLINHNFRIKKTDDKKNTSNPILLNNLEMPRVGLNYYCSFKGHNKTLKSFYNRYESVLPMDFRVVFYLVRR